MIRFRPLHIILILLHIGSIGFSPFSSHAQPQGEIRLQDGLQAYGEADYETAVDLLNAAVQSEQISDWDQVDAYKYLGISYARLGMVSDSEKTFRELLKLRPLYELANVNQDVLVIFIQARIPRSRSWLKILIPIILAGGGGAAAFTILGGKGSTPGPNPNPNPDPDPDPDGNGQLGNPPQPPNP